MNDYQFPTPFSPIIGFITTVSNKIKLALSNAVVPETHAESIVNQIYSKENLGMGDTESDLGYDPESASTPQVFVEVKKAFSNVASSLSSTFTKYALISVIILIIIVFVYGFAQGYNKK